MNKMNQIAADRYDTCRDCEHFNSVIKNCKKCGCFMPAKVLLKWSECPVGKWGKVEN